MTFSDVLHLMIPQVTDSRPSIQLEFTLSTQLFEMRYLLVSLVLLVGFVIHAAHSQCIPEDCFGHGICQNNLTCLCDPGFGGYDCSIVHPRITETNGVVQQPENYLFQIANLIQDQIVIRKGEKSIFFLRVSYTNAFVRVNVSLPASTNYTFHLFANFDSPADVNVFFNRSSVNETTVTNSFTATDFAYYATNANTTVDHLSVELNAATTQFENKNLFLYD